MGHPAFEDDYEMALDEVEWWSVDEEEEKD